MKHQHVIGIDIGGTKCDVALYENGKRAPIERRKIPTRASEGFATVLEDVIRCIMELRTKETIAIGIGVPGFVRQPSGIIRQLPNIPEPKDAM
jgi:glucokinase